MMRSKLALAAAFLGGAALFLAAAALLLIYTGAIAPMSGFRLWLYSVPVGAAAVLVGAPALWVLRARPAERRLALFGAAAGALLVFSLVSEMVDNAANNYPPINDITTNYEDPPEFGEDPAGRGRDMQYPADFAAPARAAYPDIAPLHVRDPMPLAFACAVFAASELGWDVHKSDAIAGEFFARDTSLLFRFVDDVAVRVRPSMDGGAVIDARSKSRDGQGDLGANAARIRALFAMYPQMPNDAEGEAADKCSVRKR